MDHLLMYKPIIATLAYIISPDKDKVLMVHRIKRPDDIHYGKYNGLGGKVEATEDIVASVKREIREESGLDATELVLRGTINWPGFGKEGQDWFGFIFRVDKFEGQLVFDNPEGTLEWVALSALDQLNLWESDRAWLSMVFERDTPPFHGIAPFEDGRMISWDCSRLP